MTKPETGSVWNFHGDKITIIAVSESEICFQYDKDKRFDQEIVSTWTIVAKPWKELSLIDEIIEWDRRFNIKIADKRTGTNRLFTIVEVEALKDIMKRAASLIEDLQFRLDSLDK